MLVLVLAGAGGGMAGIALTLLPSLASVQLVCSAQERWRRTKKTTLDLHYLNLMQQP